MLRLALALFALQAGFHGFTASLPVALSRAGVPDPQIGLIVGVAALVQVPAAFLAGVIVDRLGGLRMLTIGGLSYLVGCGILMLPGVEPGGPAGPFIVARIFQGIGIAGTLPAALSLVPHLTEPARRGFALAFMGSAHNLTLVAIPPLSLAVLAATSLHGVALVMTTSVLIGLALVWIRPFRFRSGTGAGGHDERPLPEARRRLGFAFRRAWAPIIAIVILFIVHWGVIVAYLPQRAEAAGADIGLFFAADGVAILLSRVPSGWLADRMRPALLMLAGLAATALAILLVALPPTTPLLVVAGLLSGVGRRTRDDADARGAVAPQRRRGPWQRLLVVLGGAGRGPGHRQHRRCAGRGGLRLRGDDAPQPRGCCRGGGDHRVRCGAPLEPATAVTGRRGLTRLPASVPQYHRQPGGPDDDERQG